MVDEFAELEGFEDEWDSAEEVRDIEFGPSDALREFVERDEYPPLDDPMADALDLGDDDTGSRLDDLEQRLLLGGPDFTPELLPDSAAAGFWARITASASAGDNQWTYTFTEVRKVVAGYSGWTVVVDGMSGTAYNSAEDINSDSGVQGNGVDPDNLDTEDYTFTIQPCPVLSIVRMYRVGFTSEEDGYEGDNVVEYWFTHENGVDGSCD